MNAKKESRLRRARRARAKIRELGVYRGRLPSRPSLIKMVMTLPNEAEGVDEQLCGPAFALQS